ncbi:MAG: hypothetical protein LBE84_09200 [Planctomycetota bacterium]|jgi:hypothetical protein|nr:hypothetical protein [Planctomycetota bacterium]
MNFGGFSWKRLLGITRLKQRISRSIGIPLTKGGRQRKLGSFLYPGAKRKGGGTKSSGCLLLLLALPAAIAIIRLFAATTADWLD